MNRVDFAKALSKAVFFTSEEDLRKKIAAQKTNRWAIVYLGVDLKSDKKGAKDPVEGTLLGHAPEIVRPYEDIYGIGFPGQEIPDQSRQRGRPAGGGTDLASQPARLGVRCRNRPRVGSPTNFPSRAATCPRTVTTLGRPSIFHPSKAL